MKTYFFFLLLSCSLIWAQSPIARLETSTRHHEWVTVDQAAQTKAYLVYPEVADKKPVVLLIHENRGLNDWVRSMADQIAEMGYIALAPDFLSGKAPNGGGTTAFENSDTARTAIYDLDPNEILHILDKTVDFAKKIPASNGKVVVIGFCWGGSQSFQFATQTTAIETAIVCYGTGPKNSSDYKNIKIPVYGFYGGNDQRVNATIAMSQQAMKQNDQIYETVVYEGAGHGFFRAGEEENASDANKKARTAGIKRLKEILSGI